MAERHDAAAEIKRLYFQASKATIARDLERAIALLISLESDEAREQVAVYMDGLAQMRSEWGVRPAAKASPAAAAKSATKVPLARAATDPAPPRRSRR